MEIKKLRPKAILLAILLFISCQLANAETAYTNVDGINYKLDYESMTAEVNSVYDVSGDIVLPEYISYNGKVFPLTSIGYNAFLEHRSKVTSVVIPSTVTSIEYGAFSCCYLLTSVVIPSSVTSIGDYAFGECGSLASITIPSSVVSIGELAFSRCSSLISIIVEEGNRIYDSRNGCNAIIETATNKLIVGCSSSTISSSVTSIGKGAFFGCATLTSITIPSGVASIGEMAFEECENLTSVSIPSSVTSIGDGAFSGCI